MTLLTCGGVGVVVDLPPDMISSVMSRPPWLGSRIVIYKKARQISVKFPQNIKIQTVCNDAVTTDLQLPPVMIDTIVIYR